MVMVARMAANIRGPAVVDELAERPGLAKQLDGAVHGRKAELRIVLPRPVKELEGGECGVETGDRVEDNLPFRGQSSASGEGERVIVGSGHGPHPS